jgi:hypothetical protein
MRNAMLVQYNTLSSNGHQTEGGCGERRDILETKTRVVLRTDTTFQSPGRCHHTNELRNPV